jgi:hypothetical protein
MLVFFSFELKVSLKNSLKIIILNFLEIMWCYRGFQPQGRFRVLKSSPIHQEAQSTYI